MIGQDLARRSLAAADAAMNRLYRWPYNPLYHSGVIAAALFAVLLVTGLYLVFVYRLSAPYESVARLAAQPWLGGWIRSLHRYASDAAVIAALVHAFRMFAQGRSWGPRALAWITGVILLGVVMLCGWTGYVMVWDVQGQVLAQAGARLFDALPIFAEPISRAFMGERPLPDAFFFLNLFAHIAVPIGLGLLLWLHVSRVARPVLMPPRRLAWAGLAVLVALSLAWPAPLGPPADLLRLPPAAPYDLFYVFWLPWAQAWPAWAFLAVVLAANALVMVVPWLSRPPVERRPATSTVDERLCTGCEQCFVDCPYEAIAMVDRAPPLDGRSALVARVNPERCVSCGICAGSCAPMGVGPTGRTGRDQLRRVQRFAGEHRLGPATVVVAACDRAVRAETPLEGAILYPVSCAGSLHTSVVEYFARRGAAGVLLVACPPRDCWNREGPKWLEQRLYHEREAELQARVDRRRVRLAFATAAAPDEVTRALAAFRAELEQLEAPRGEDDPDLLALCETAS
jgi:coenzyme F420-reducing hydrogenase delta subunit/Pyruvate/2-oxoacid:ferredoxin oxidoreductase delta subunit